MRTSRGITGAAAFVLAVTLGGACSKGSESTPAPPAFEYAGTYATQYRWGGQYGAWNANRDLHVTAAGEVYWGTTRILSPTVGTDTLSWSMADGNGTNVDVTFADSSTSTYYWGPGGHTGPLFEGMIQYPGEGGSDFRGVPRQAGGTAAGVLGGVHFTPVDFVSEVMGPATCPPGISMTGLQLVFSGTPSACGWLQTLGACDVKANLVAVGAAIIRLNDGGGVAPEIAPGVYPLSYGTRDGANVTAAQWAYVHTNATCVDAAENVTPTGGALTIESISAGYVTGSISATFSDGSTFSGTFSAPRCSGPADLCTNCPSPGACR